MDKLTKEEYRKYLVDFHKRLEKRLNNDLSFSHSKDRVEWMKIDVYVMKEIYMLDNEK